MEQNNPLPFSADQASRPEPNKLPALTLAYIGDTVYDLFVRTKLAFSRDATVHALHMAAAKLVCAKGQAEAFHRISELLSEEEQAAFKRGRNAHSGTVPKHADVRDYRIATGFEALLGYLYCLGREERITELMEKAIYTEE